MAFTLVGKGCDSTALFGYEDVAYGTVAATLTTVFGNGATVGVNLNNNTERLYGLGARNAQKLVTKKFDVSWNADFALGNAYFLRAVLGTKTAETGTGAFGRTYQENNTCPSISIRNAFNLDTDSQHTILGAKVNSMTINCNAGEIAKVRLEGFGQNMVKTSTLGTTDSGDDEDPLIFSGASIKLGSTTGLDVQSMEITVGNNIEMLYGLGSRFATKAVEKSREYSFRINEAYEDDSLMLEPFMGNATTPATSPANITSLVATFTNGLSTTFLRSLQTTFSNIQLPTYDYTMDVNEILKENATYFALSCGGFTYTNNSSNSP